MTCAAFIIPPGAVLAADDTIAHAAHFLAANGFLPVPVVDGDRRVTGVFGPGQLAALALPAGARLAGESFDLSFVSESPQDLHDRLAAEGAAKVGDHCAPVKPLRAETSLDEVLLRVYRGETAFVAVDADGRLLGTVLAAAVLAALVGA